MEIISWILFIVLIAGVLTLGGLLLRGYLKNDSGNSLLTGTLFSPKPPEKRLDVVDQMTIDGRRRLVLIRRDNVEHLIMTGGPVDVVIETSIASHGKPARTDPTPAAPKTARPHSIDDDKSPNSAPPPDKTAGD